MTVTGTPVDAEGYIARGTTTANCSRTRLPDAVGGPTVIVAVCPVTVLQVGAAW